jgi:hypothetical protein
MLIGGCFFVTGFHCLLNRFQCSIAGEDVIPSMVPGFAVVGAGDL